MAWLLDSFGTFISSTVLGFRDDSTGALSANWTARTGVTPTDIAVKADLVNIAWQPTTSTVQPFFRQTSSALSQIGGFKLWAAVKTKSNLGGGYGRSGFGVLSGVRTGSLANADYPLWIDLVGFTSPQAIRLSVAGTVITSPFTITSNEWYLMGIEKIGSVLRGLINPTSQANIANLGSPDTMSEFAAINLTTAGNVIGGDPYLPFIILSTVATSATDYDGIGDLSVAEYSLPGAPLDISIGDFGTPFAPYQRYKSIRQAVQIYNNVGIGP